MHWQEAEPAEEDKPATAADGVTTNAFDAPSSGKAVTDVSSVRLGGDAGGDLVSWSAHDMLVVLIDAPLLAVAGAAGCTSQGQESKARVTCFYQPQLYNPCHLEATALLQARFSSRLETMSQPE